MPLSAACSRVQKAPYGTCGVHEPGAGSPAILSPDNGHGQDSEWEEQHPWRRSMWWNTRAFRNSPLRQSWHLHGTSLGGLFSGAHRHPSPG